VHEAGEIVSARVVRDLLEHGLGRKIGGHRL
jgi:hypothetical protein